MSRIRRLSLRGVRNFGDEREEAIINFSRPLTLILGPNGTGKTTIIEALKYATCGEFPPNSERGKFFIHDPTLTMTSLVRAVVKAEIVDKVGNVITICRTLECSKITGTSKLKTLDSTLSRLSKGSDKVVSISNRCMDVDIELTSTMGVSKSILDYVIFCHQEDLSWPFNEGKKLKEKFDEIFDSTNYNKALEGILKHIKESTANLKLLQVEEKSHSATVAQVKEKEQKLKDHKIRLKAAIEKVEELKHELEPLTQRIKNLEKIDTKYKDLQIQKKSKKTEYNLSKEQIERLQENIDEEFDGSMEKLVAEIHTYDEKLEEKVDTIKQLETRMRDIDKTEIKISNLLATENVTSGSLKQQDKDHKKKISSRNRMLNEVLMAWQMDTVDSNVSETDVTVLTKRLQGKILELEHKLEDKKRRRAKEENELQKQADIARSEYSKIESEKNMKDSEVVETRNEIYKIEIDLLQLEAAIKKLNSMESKVQTVKTKIEHLNETLNINTAKEELIGKIKLRDETETKLNAVDEEITLLLKQSSLQAELELHNNSLASKEKELLKLKDKYEKTIKNLMDIKELKPIKLKDKLDKTQRELISQLESTKHEIQIKEIQSNTLETTLSHVESELYKKKKEIEADKEKVSLVCKYQDFNESVLSQSRLLKDLQDRRGIYAYQAVVYKDYIKQLKETSPCCPLCHRSIEERQAVENLLKEMEVEMENYPNRLKKCESELKIQQEKYDKMLQLKPAIEKIIRFEENEQENLMNNLEKSKSELAKLQTSITELKNKKSDPEERLTLIQNITSDIVLWDKCIDDITKHKQTIDSFQIRMINTGIKSERSIEEAQKERDELKTLLKSIRCDIESLQSSINAQNEKMNNAREELNALHEEQLKLRADVQEVQQLKDKREILLCKKDLLAESVDDLKHKFTIAKDNLTSEIEKLEKKRKENAENQEMDRKLLAEGSRRLTDLEKIQEEVDAFVYRKISEALENSENKIKRYENSIKDIRNEKSNSEATMNELKEQISRHEVRKRNLSDNLLLRKARENHKILKQQYSDLSNELNSINYSQIIEEWENIRNREEVLRRQRNISIGNQEELERVIEQSTAELQQEVYKKAHEEHRKKCIEITTLEEIISNFKVYSQALDRAVLEFHEERMASVNRIMKKLWKVVYTGSDTSSIEIRTDVTKSVGGGKRSYTYKLVQTKHGHEIDMRGRCSAGQRVLASIIIRLALAETFCKDCGILALDEPTTNLDQENADSLANALASVVKLRSQYQKNFQLIVISHDERFLFKLAELSENKGFHQLYRKNNGYSSIKYCQVESLISGERNMKEGLSSEDESNEHFAQLQNKAERNSREKLCSDSLYSRKRSAEQTDSAEHTDVRPSKKRYVLHI
ncbi:DNA repair protein rad50 [Augochlora pura]